MGRSSVAAAEDKGGGGGVVERGLSVEAEHCACVEAVVLYNTPLR